MSDDIVARLRGTIPSIYDARDAADEIERLRAERDALRELLREAREYVWAGTYANAMLARIDAALETSVSAKLGDGDGGS